MSLAVESPAMKLRVAVLLLLSAALGSCGAPKEEGPAPLSHLIINSHVTFVGADGKTLREAPKEPLRLWMPYVVGDFYGAPNAGELVPVELRPDMSFSVNLNAALPLIPKALIPTAFSQKWMAIEPVEARVARLSPFVLPSEGIVPVGMTEWLDAAHRCQADAHLCGPAGPRTWRYRLRGTPPAIRHRSQGGRFPVDTPA